MANPFRRKLLLLGGAAVVAASAALLNREKVKQLLPGGSSGEPTYSPPGPPQQSNYDAPGPVANTSTPIPAPEPVLADPVQDSLDPDHGEATGQGDADLLAAQAAALDDAAAGDEPIALVDAPLPTADSSIDEREEEQAAAAEAAAIGGSPTDYAGSELDSIADESERPLAEAGEGVAEGQEQAEAALETNLEPPEGPPTDAERRIDDTIEQASRPSEGETPEPLVSDDEASKTEGSQEKPDEESGGWETWHGGAVKPDQG